MDTIPNAVYSVSTVGMLKKRPYDFVEVQVDKSFPSPVGKDGFPESLNSILFSEVVSANGKVKRWRGEWIEPQFPQGIPNHIDFTFVNFRMPILSERAIECLGDFLTETCELLPVRVGNARYYFMHTLVRSDALDLKTSDYDVIDEAENRFLIGHHEFVPDRLSGQHVFRIRQEPTFLMVSDFFVQRCQTEGLFGFYFRQVWPIERETFWVMRDGVWPRPKGMRASAAEKKKKMSSKKKSKSMSWTVSEVPSDISANLFDAALEGAELCQVEWTPDREAIARKIDETIETYQIFRKDNETKSFFSPNVTSMGALLGEFMRRVYGWTWQQLESQGGAESGIAVVSPNREFAIFPFNYCHETVRSNELPKLQLMVSLIEHEGFPEAEEGELNNLLDQVHRLI